MLPCIENKCLVLSACINKKHIKCPMLEDYYFDRRQLYSKEEVWKNIKRELIGLVAFRCSYKQYPIQHFYIYDSVIDIHSSDIGDVK